MRINEIIDVRSIKTIKAMILKIDHQISIIQTFEKFGRTLPESVIDDSNMLLDYVEKFLLFKIISDPSTQEALRNKLEELRSKLEQ